jgi:hypothetical protein
VFHPHGRNRNPETSLQVPPINTGKPICDFPKPEVLLTMGQTVRVSRRDDISQKLDTGLWPSRDSCVWTGC